MLEETISYDCDGIESEAFFARPEGDGPFPGVMLAHAWMGVHDETRDKARAMAKAGYAAFCADVYGKGNRATDIPGAQALMNPLASDRGGALARRLRASLAAFQSHASVDATRVAAVGHCFGGLCVLDMVRMGADIRAAVSVHGILAAQSFDGAEPNAKVLALHGYDDPMAPPDAMAAFCAEMTSFGLDWQLHAFGGTQHAFTNPDAANDELGLIYNESAARRSQVMILEFLREVLA